MTELRWTCAQRRDSPCASGCAWHVYVILDLTEMRPPDAASGRGDRQQRGQTAGMLFEQLDVEQFFGTR